MTITTMAPSAAARTPAGVEAQAPGSTMRRPRQTDEPIRRAAAASLADDCAAWDGNTKTAENWIEPLMRCHDWHDGYALARDLDRYSSVMPDAELVEILDGAASHLTKVHEDAVRAWVKIVGFAPRHGVGDVVRCRHGEGPVHQVRVELAQYVVDVERRGNGGYIVNAEDVDAD